jgi:type III restriction enzyme
MLTEGWDANTVTHIMGVRAFGTQLLCEQVVGRALRRTTYVTNDSGLFDPEYAEVYGVPFSFIPCAGSQPTPRQGPTPTRVRALEERIACEITFPRVEGYRYEFPEERIRSKFTDDSLMPLSTYDIPTRTELAPIIGETTYHDLYAFKLHRDQEVIFQIAKLVLERYFRDDQGNVRQWLFPQLIAITRDWIKKCVRLKDNAFIQMLLIREEAHSAAEKIYQSIVTAEPGPGYLKPLLRQYDNIGSTRYVDFTTTRPVYPTHPDKCHISHVVADTESWEQKTAQAIEDMDEVFCYVKNQGLNFTIPYAMEGEERNYIPDYIVRLRTNDGDILNLILETSGEPRKDKAAKVAAARNLWVPAINNHGSFGKWDFLEITDPWDAQNTIRAFVGNKETEQ